MPNNDKVELTKRQASVINRSNRKLSGNLNALMDQLNTTTYGIQRTDKINNLIDEFNSLMKSEITDLNTRADGDTTGFLTKLFSQNNKRISTTLKDLEELFNTNEEQLEAFITQQYKNRLLKQADLHEVASQLVELKEAITITRDAIISADIVSGHMSRNIVMDDDEMEEDQDNYIPIIEKMEKKFHLQEKIKNFIIPRSLEYGEYYVYCIPYSKLFEDFSREKIRDFNNGYRVQTIGEKTLEEKTKNINLYDFIHESSKKTDLSNLQKSVTESVTQDEMYSHYKGDKSDASTKRELNSELDAYLKNIEVNNNPVPLPVIEEGVASIEEYFTEFVQDSMNITEATPSGVSFDKIMKDIDDGVLLKKSSAWKGTRPNNKESKSKDNDFSEIKDCYVKLIDPIHLLPIELMNETIGYYHIQEEDITPLAGILTSTMYYDRMDMNHTKDNVLSAIADTIVDSFDKKFLVKNEKFKNLIVEALNYYKLNNRKIKFQFIPKEYVIPFKINEDETGHGVSIIEDSLFYAKLYLMLLLFKMMSIVNNSNDTKVNYIRHAGIDRNVANKIQEIARKKQQRSITLADMFSYTTLINKVGQGSEMYVPTGRGNERGIETEILQGQDVQLNTELLDLLKKAYVTGTGVPDVLLNYYNEADFAKTLELANNRFQGRVVSFQLDYNTQITELYRIIARYSTTIDENIINSLEFNFVQPKASNATITSDILNNHNTLVEFLTQLYFGQDAQSDEAHAEHIKNFKLQLAKERLNMLDFDGIDKMYKDSMIEGTEKSLDPSNQTQEEQ